MKQLFMLATLLLAACAVGPNYVRPPVTVPAKFKENKDWKIAEPCDTKNNGEWWTLFNDPYLNSLENELNHNNQSIANALANYYQSVAIVSEARAGFFPTISGAFNIFRQKSGGGSTTFISSANGNTTTGTAATGTSIAKSTIRTTFSAFLNASWEPDLWGLVRRTVEANVAAAQANEALLASTGLSAQGSLAQYYFELRTLDSDQQLLDYTVKAYQKSLQLTRNQYKAGVASRSDIVQAQSQLETAQSQAINNGILRGQYEHAIAVLIGRPPADFTMAFMPLNSKPPVIPVTVPTIWLERRPDIAQAERLIQQANAQIGVAIAAYYPTLNLSGSLSAAGSSFKRLIHTPAIGWAYGLELAETLYDGGLRQATVRASQAAYMAQVANYRQTVLSAFQDVEDNLIALHLLTRQAVVQKRAAADANKALQLMLNQYKSGTVDYSSVITAQIAAFNAQKTAIDVVGLQMTSAVALIKALGGGWSTAEIHPV